MPEQEPTLAVYMSWLALEGLGPFERGPLEAVRAEAYNGVQFIQPLGAGLAQEARALGLEVCGSGRINRPDDAYPLALEARDNGLEFLSIHLGWGLEDDSDCFRLIDSVLNASLRARLPLYPETHRATIFQDMWRTVHFVQRYPELRFTGDFSHWYTGLEMVYGDFDRKLTFIQPVLERTRFLHGRIGSPGCIQVAIGNGATGNQPFVEHFKRIWKQVFTSFLGSSDSTRRFCFAPELLAPSFFYARTFDGVEESDRWEQSLVVAQIARECFVDALSKLSEANQ